MKGIGMWPHLVAALIVACAPMARAADAPPDPTAPKAELGAPVPPPASLKFGPPPKWVIPAVIPAPGADADGALQLLLSDNQNFLGPDGDETYTHSAVRILNESGLAAVGTLQQSWNPETDVLTLHAIRIRRGDQVIDVLKSGAGITVLRREANLEKASLDGRLTATLQIEDLRVGDILEKEGTLRHRDPALAGFSQLDTGLSSRSPIAHARFRVLWPKTKPIQWRAVEGLPAPRVSQTAGLTELTVDLDDAKAPIPPPGAPGRYRYRAQLEVTQFASWAQAAGVMAPLFAKASTLAPGSPLVSEIAAIAARTNSPAERASLALALVERKVRYQFIGLNDGGYVPAPADQTWARRYGDCKGKTALLLALLHGLDIEAEPVLVSTGFGDGMDERLPQLAYFDHVVVRARVGGAWYWLDGTRPSDPTAIGDLTPPPYKWGLPLRPADAALLRIEPAPLKQPLDEETTWIDASAGLDAPAPERREAVTHGDLAIGLGVSLNVLPHAQAEQALRDAFAETASSFELKSIDWTFDPDTATFTLRATGLAHLDWRWNRDIGAREHLLTDVSATPPPGPPKREPGPDADAPYAVAFPAWSVKHTTIVLPDHGRGFSVVGENVDATVGGAHHSRRVALANGVVTLESSTRTIAPEYPASEAKAVTRLRADINDDPVAVRAPKGQRAPID
jgi:hypothetical protein